MTNKQLLSLETTIYLAASFIIASFLGHWALIACQFGCIGAALFSLIARLRAK